VRLGGTAGERLCREIGTQGKPGGLAFTGWSRLKRIADSNPATRRPDYEGGFEVITRNYKPPTDALIFSLKIKVDGKLVDGPEKQIRCTRTYLRLLQISDAKDQEFLQGQLIGESICPPMLFFKDSERARQLLKATEYNPEKK
jgi:hypothetical protein